MWPLYSFVKNKRRKGQKVKGLSVFCSQLVNDMLTNLWRVCTLLSLASWIACAGHTKHFKELSEH